MKFRITSTYAYGEEDLIRDYPMLNDFGFEVAEEQYTSKQRIKNPDGGYLIQEIPVVRKNAFINIGTLEEFMKLSRDVGYALILLMPDKHECMDTDIPEIEIYDGYRE